MFALVALICFALALVKVTLAGIDLVVLGLCFISLQLMFGWGFDRFRRTP